MAENEGINFGDALSKEEEQRYREQIEAARRGGGVAALKGKDPVGRHPRVSVPLPQDGQEGGVQPRPPGSPLLRPETAQLLQEAAAQQVKQVKDEKAEEKKEDDKKASEDLFESFDFSGRNEQERVLNNKARRAAIESRCEPMALEDLLMRDEVKQLVPILPGKFEVLFRSMTPEDSLFVKQYIATHEQGKTDQYVLEKYGICQLTCSLISINGRAFPDHRDAEGVPNEKLFEAKLKMMLKKSTYVIGDLSLNYYWFDIRVRKLLNPDALGNG